MGQYKDFQNAYHRHIEDMANDPLNKALDALYNISAGIYNLQQEKDQEAKSEEKFNRQLRLRETERLGRLHPDVDPYTFGNVVINENDFMDYKNEIIQKENLNTLGKQYQPTGGVVSEEAQRDMFTYGDTRYSLDTSPGIVSQDDLFNFDAWLLGEHGYGRDVAMKHQHKGILYEDVQDVNSPYYGKYILDRGDYQDLKDKGLVPNMIPDASGNYIVDSIQRNDIVKKYNYWREGFVSSRELPTKSKLTGMIGEQNKVDFEFENELRKNAKYETIFDQLDNWRDIMDPNKSAALVNDDYDYATDFIIDGQVTPKSYSQQEFMEKYPLVYNMLTTNITIESVAEDVISNPELQQQLAEMPQLNAYIMQQLSYLNDVNVERRKQGIGGTQAAYIEDANIIGNARDTILKDLNSGSLGFGIMFDQGKYGQLTEVQQDQLVNDLIALESSYSDRNSVNYNPSILRFLSLYGYDPNKPGFALEAVMDELRNR
tara:strand:+ start:654 stop:2114 length:1461 start_codon:yes stop_codon:yes gene_type:complete